MPPKVLRLASFPCIFTDVAQHLACGFHLLQQPQMYIHVHINRHIHMGSNSPGLEMTFIVSVTNREMVSNPESLLWH